MDKIIDLHIHSNFSEDADLSINEIFNLSQDSHISAISITDHDSIKSIEICNSLKRNYDFEYVPGVEITTIFPIDNSQQHILGYFIDDNNPELKRNLDRIADMRTDIAAKRIEALKQLGFTLDEGNIKKMIGERPATPVSIILELFQNKNNSNDARLHAYLYDNKKDNKIASFYRDYLSNGKPAYIPFRSISSQEGIDVIKEAGGIPILAHPIYLKEREQLDIIKEMGIVGIEAVSTYHKPEDIDYYLKYAENNNLLVTAGSDFHGPTAKPHIKLGTQNSMKYMYFEKLKALALLKRNNNL